MVRSCYSTAFRVIGRGENAASIPCEPSSELVEQVAAQVAYEVDEDDAGVEPPAAVDSPEGENTFETDLIILAVGRKPVNHLSEVAEEWVDEVWAIGDCIAPRKVKDAVWEAYKIGRII